jgi:hypothetical protein
MVEDMPLPLKDRYKRHQGESENQNQHNESDRTTNVGGPGILVLIVKGRPILRKGDLLEPDEPALRGTEILLIFCDSGRMFEDF